MASFARLLALLLCASVSIHVAAATTNTSTSTSAAHACKPFYPIIAFGDSTTDTGNQIRSSKAFAPAAHPPYGMTFFKRPTGRYCDGRLMVDFLTSALKVDFLPPHLARVPYSASENFAVAGATSLDLKTLHDIANVTSTTPVSLDRQVAGFKYDTAKLDLSDALIYFGEIGGNDYNYALGARRSPQVLEALIAPDVERIAAALDTLLKHGVKHIVVQGQFPMGCISLYEKVLNGTKTDKNGCIQSVMEISDRHNRLLKESLRNLSKTHKHANIVFFDTSAAYVHILEHAMAFNFTNVHDPCYAEGLAMLVAPPPSTSGHQPMPLPTTPPKACPNPQNYISWDGIHLTDAMYGTMMKLFLTHPKFSSPFPNFLSTCTKT